MNIEDYWLQTQMQNRQAPASPNPALAAAMQQQMPQHGGANPLSSGAESAIGAVKQSLQAEPKKGFGSQLLDTIGRTISNVGVAGLRGSNIGVEQELGRLMEAPREREQRVFKENSDIMKHLYERALDEADYRLKQQDLQETQRHHNMTERHYRASEARGAKEDREREYVQNKTNQLQDKYPGAIPFEAMTKAEISRVSRELNDLNRNSQGYAKILKNVDELDRIINDYPDLSEWTGRAFITKEGEQPGFWDLQKLKLMDKDKRAAYEKARKIIADMKKHEIKGMSGKVVTDVFKQTIGESLPSLNSTPEALKYVTKSIREDYRPVYQYSREANDMIKGRFVVPMTSSPYEGETPGKTKSGISDSAMLEAKKRIRQNQVIEEAKRRLGGQ
jgi:hypothetical protein